MSYTIASVAISYEDDLVAARHRARQVAGALSFDEQDKTRIATAVSEVARAFFQGDRATEVQFTLEGERPPQLLLVHIAEQKGALKSNGARKKAGGTLTGSEWTAACLAAGRLMDQCQVDGPAMKPVAIRLAKLLPKLAPFFTVDALHRISRDIDQAQPQDPVQEVRQQNHELIQALEQLHLRQQELLRLNRELEDTNRGVVALYAELDEKAEHLRRADEMKSQFLSNMTHEFRTPLNTIIALSQMMLDRTDGELNGEQEKQAGFIKKSGESLLELVNDLLDLAKIEAGKITITPAPFEAATLFSALRGMLRPLLLTESVALVFEPVDGMPLMMTDEGKVSQILRNFISNALKFTERGEIRVRASVTDDGQAVAFSVSDTGIGIAPEDQARIFEEFTQIDNPLQRKVKGTGLGLPLCRKLASLLGGSVHVTSQLGAGSTFVAVIPIHYAAPEPTGADSGLTPLVEVKAGSVPVLVVEDEPETCLLYEKYLRRTAFQPIAAGSLFQARELLRRYHFAAIILDIVLPGDSAWSWLAELKGRDDTKNIPILVVSSVDDRPKGLALGADDYALKPVRREWLLNRLEQLIGQAAAHVVKKNPIVLIIDDQEADRYILRRYFSELGYACVEAVDGEEGLQLAVQRKPTVILLDFNLPGVNGAEILMRLSQDPMTLTIPVIVVTAELLSPEVRAKLLGAKLILPKQGLTSAICERALRDINL